MIDKNRKINRKVPYKTETNRNSKTDSHFSVYLSVFVYHWLRLVKIELTPKVPKPGVNCSAGHPLSHPPITII